MVYFEGAAIGVIVGLAYAAFGLTVTLTFRTTGFLSFAHAAFALFAAFGYVELAGTPGAEKLAPPVAAVLALALTALYGLVVERVALRRAQHAPPATKIIVGLGVLTVTEALIVLRHGGNPVTARPLIDTGFVNVGGLGVSHQRLATGLVSLALAVGLALFLSRTRLGLLLRASASNSESAQLCGGDLRMVARINWLTASILSGVVGILVAPEQILSVVTFPLLLVKAFAACAIGGMVSLPLTFVGGVLVGVVETETVLFDSSPGTRELAMLALVIGTFMLRSVRAPAAGDRRDDHVGAGAPMSGELRRPPALRRSGVDPRAALLGTAVTVVLVGSFPLRSEFWAIVGCLGVFYLLECLSLVMISGWAGQVSLMHGAYVGIGAFVTAYLVGSEGWPLWLAIIGAVVTGIVLGLVLVWPALRASSIEFAILSLVVAAAVTQWLFQRPGLYRTLPRGELFGLDLNNTRNLFAVMALIALGVMGVLVAFSRSFGYRVLIASRDIPGTLAQFGYWPPRSRVLAFLVASGIASLGGALYALTVTAFNPQDFTFQLAISLLLFAVVGGVYSVGGALIAALAFGVVPEALNVSAAGTGTAWPGLISGSLILLLIGLRPRGLAQVGADLRSALGGWWRANLQDGRFEADQPAPERWFDSRIARADRELVR